MKPVQITVVMSFLLSEEHDRKKLAHYLLDHGTESLKFETRPFQNPADPGATNLTGIVLVDQAGNIVAQELLGQPLEPGQSTDTENILSFANVEKTFAAEQKYRANIAKAKADKKAEKEAEKEAAAKLKAEAEALEAEKKKDAELAAAYDQMQNGATEGQCQPEGQPA